MGTMEKMRNSTPIILWVLIFSFGVLWVLQDTQVFDVMTNAPRSVGSVNGDAIELDEYNSRVSYYIDQHNQRSSTPVSEEVRSSYEVQAWEDLVAERLMAQKMEDIGIKVTDAELVEMVTGDNPDPFIQEQFQDEEGNIDRIALQAAIEDPGNQEIWVMIEQQLRQNRQQQKLTNFIASGLRVSMRDVEAEFVRRNSFAEFSFVRFPYGDVPADQVQVTENQLRDYYNNNQDQFQREETYRFRYVTFEKVPTAEDTLRSIQDVEDLIPRFEEAEDHESFLQQNESMVPFNESYVSTDEIRDEYLPVLDLEVGEVSEVMMINDVPHAFKLVDRQDGEVQFAILAYEVFADPIGTIDRLAEEAEEFSFYAGSEGFEQEVERNNLTIREAVATRGTPFVPGLGQSSQLVNRLENMSPGDVSDAVELTDRFIVVQMTERIQAGTRPFEEVRPQIESIVRGQIRKDAALQNASQYVGEGQSLEEIAAAAGREVQVMNNLAMSGNTITGAGREPGIVGAIFGLEAGETSSLLEGLNAAFVVEVHTIERADPEMLSPEQRNQIRQELEQQKFEQFAQIWIEELKEEASIRDNRHILFGL
ncbi:MAG: SurA N-terminal domain-containing protein [Balneolaceae bacterium]